MRNSQFIGSRERSRLLKRITTSMEQIKKVFKKYDIEVKTKGRAAEQVLSDLIDLGYDNTWAICDAFDVLTDAIEANEEKSANLLPSIYYLACWCFVKQCEEHGVDYPA